MSSHRPFFRSALFPLIVAFVVAAAYAVAFFVTKSSADAGFNAVVNAIPSVKKFGPGIAPQIQEYAQTYGALVAVLVGLLLIVAGYIVYGIFALARLTRLKFGVALASLLTVAPLMYVGYAFMHDVQHTAIAVGVARYIGVPLYWSAIAGVIFIAICFILSFFISYVPATDASRK